MRRLFLLFIGFLSFNNCVSELIFNYFNANKHTMYKPFRATVSTDRELTLSYSLAREITSSVTVLLLSDDPECRSSEILDKVTGMEQYDNRTIRRKLTCWSQTYRIMFKAECIDGNLRAEDQGLCNLDQGKTISVKSNIPNPYQALNLSQCVCTSPQPTTTTTSALVQTHLSTETPPSRFESTKTDMASVVILVVASSFAAVIIVVVLYYIWCLYKKLKIKAGIVKSGDIISLRTRKVCRQEQEELERSASEICLNPQNVRLSHSTPMLSDITLSQHIVDGQTRRWINDARNSNLQYASHWRSTPMHFEEMPLRYSDDDNGPNDRMTTPTDNRLPSAFVPYRPFLNGRASAMSNLTDCSIEIQDILNS